MVSIHDYLKTLFPNNFEIIIIPNGTRGKGDQTDEIAGAVKDRFSEVKIVPHKSPKGKGAALRTGFRQSRGEWVFFMDADLPYDLSFFTEAARLLTDGFDFVTGNRRIPQSRFDIPVPLLHLAYRRHCIGLIFNRAARWLFSVPTTDTQAGVKAMSRRMAEVAFSRQTCPGFFFDLEFFLCCAGFNFRVTEIPVKFSLNSEKSTVQLIRESLLAGIWLTKIFWRKKRGWYAVPTMTFASQKKLTRHGASVTEKTE